MKAEFTVALLAAAMLCVSAMAQENTAEDWFSKGQELQRNDSHEEALQAYEKAIQIDPESARAWMGKGNALLSLKRYNESMEAYERAVEILNGSQKDDPEDAEAWWLKAESLDSMGRSDAALEAYDRVIALNSSKALGAWIRKSDIFASLGRYNESVEAFDGALNLLPTQDKQSIMSLWWARGIDIYHNAWIADGQILRTASAWRNQSTGAIENIMLVNSDFTAAWQRPTMGKAVSADGKPLGRHDEALQSSGANWAQYGFPGPKEAAQENTADSWMKKGYELMGNRSYEEAIKAMQKAVELDPENATLWDAKAQSLAFAVSFSGNLSEYNESLNAEDKAIELDPDNSTLLVHKGFLLANLADISGRGNESLYEDAIKEFDKAILLNPQDKEAWNWKGMVLDTRLNRTSEALAAYDKVIEIGGTNASDKVLLANAWSAKGGALAKLGRDDESTAAFDNAIELNPLNAASIWYMRAATINASGKYDEAVKAYDKVIALSQDNVTTALAYGGRGAALIKLGKYNEAVTAYDKAIQLFPLEQMGGLAWYKKGVALKALGKQSEADAAFAKAKELGYEVPNDSEDNSSSTPVKMLAITSIKATGEDEFVEIANSRTVAQSLNGWTLNISDGSNQSIALPDFTLGPDERINVHLGRGESSKTDIYLNSAIALNDTAGNITLKDETEKDVASFGYRVEPNGSLTGIMTAEGEFSYPQSDSNEVKMAVREAGSGPYVAERTEYELDAAYNWVDKGNVLAEQGNYEEAIKALDNATELNPQDKHIWMSKGLIFAAHLGRYNESIEAYEWAIQIDLKDADAWFGKGAALNKTGRYEEAIQALNRATDLNPKLVAAWKVTGDALKALGRNSEADAAYDKAKELGYQG